MSNSKSKSSRRPSRTKQPRLGLLALFSCESISFEFSLPKTAFDFEGFYEAAHIATDDRNRWFSVIPARAKESDFHIHFRGRVSETSIRLFIEYAGGEGSPEKDAHDVFAEDFVAWLARFIKEDQPRTLIYGTFKKSTDRWRSRFNLPFKVMLTGLDIEIAIDGISAQLPDNEYKAKKGWLTRKEDHISANVLLVRPMNVRGFDLHTEIKSANAAVLMLVEEIQS